LWVWASIWRFVSELCFQSVCIVRLAVENNCLINLNLTCFIFCCHETWFYIISGLLSVKFGYVLVIYV
jgi:hypothetical protein